MIKQLTCIECPKGCRISVETEGGVIKDITGFGCKKGEVYAKEEIINPMRIFTSSVFAEGHALKMVPVRTDKPIPKNMLFMAMDRIKKLKADKLFKTGDVIEKDFIAPGVDLVVTRDLAE